MLLYENLKVKEKKKWKDTSTGIFPNYERVVVKTTYLFRGKPYTGKTVKYYKEGDQKEFTGQMENGQPVGEWIYYYPNGNKKSEGDYKTGEWYEYPEDFWDEK